MKDMQGARFKAEKAMKAGAPWRELFYLAKLCEGAGLTTLQAEVVRLTALRCDHEEIAEELGRTANAVRTMARQIEWRLRCNQSWIPRALAEDVRVLLECLRNTFNPKPAVPIFRKCPGGWDTVRFRAKPEGTVAEDVTQEEGYLLRSLPRLLISRRMDQAAP